MELQYLRASFMMHQVVRWHMVGQYPRQDVAQHSFRVAFIAAHICDIAIKDGIPGLDGCRAFVFGAMHDLGESVTGDIPSHVKKAIKKAGIDVDILAEKEGIFDVPESYKWIVKSADLMEALIFSEEQRQSTDSRGKQVSDHIRRSWESHLNSFGGTKRIVITKAYEDVSVALDSRYNYDLEIVSERE